MAHERDDLTSRAHRGQVIEVGVPFTDPMADGTTIQRANEVKFYKRIRCMAPARKKLARWRLHLPGRKVGGLGLCRAFRGGIV